MSKMEHIIKLVRHGDAVRLLSSVFVITQSNREFSVIWLLKISLKQLLFEWGTFSECLVYQGPFTFWKELCCLFQKSLLPSLTFVNCEGPYWSISSHPLPMFRYCVCAIRSHRKNNPVNTRRCFNVCKTSTRRRRRRIDVL